MPPPAPKQTQHGASGAVGSQDELFPRAPSEARRIEALRRKKGGQAAGFGLDTIENPGGALSTIE